MQTATNFNHTGTKKVKHMLSDNQQRDGISILTTHYTNQLNQDCQDWLEYTLHAHGDEYVYRSGIEALANRLHIMISKVCDTDKAQEIICKMDILINKHYLTDSIFEKFEEQKDKSFNRTHLKPID